MRWLSGWVIGMALAIAAALVGAAEQASVRVDEPRAYGHVLGDLITRQVHIALPAGRTLAPNALPRPGRVDAWLDLHSVTLMPRDAAPGAPVTLLLNYQVVNVGPKVTTTVLPPLHLALAGGAAAESVEIDDWPVHLGPMTAESVVARAGLQALQPDIVPRREPIAPIVWRLAACAALGLLVAAPLLLRRFPQLAFWRRHAPLRAAWRDVGALRSQARRERDAAQRDALLRRAVARQHAAFDAAAGRAVFAQQLEPLYRAQPGLRAAAADIEAFFKASRQIFFAGTDAAASLTFDDVQALSLRCARLESGTPGSRGAAG
jgi:mxaA protein